MARAQTSTLRGTAVGYGTRDTHNFEPSQVHTKGRINQGEVRIDHTTIASLASGIAPTGRSFRIPAGAIIKSAKLVVLEVFADLTSIVVGTMGSDGVVEDADGLIASTVLTAIDAVGDTIEGAGTQISTPLATDEDLYICLDVTGTAPTSGEAILLVEYLDTSPSSTPPSVLVGEQ